MGYFEFLTAYETMESALCLQGLDIT